MRGGWTSGILLYKRLLKVINATVKFNFLPLGEYEQRYPLLLSTGEPFDLIYAANWIQYANLYTYVGSVQAVGLTTKTWAANA